MPDTRAVRAFLEPRHHQLTTAAETFVEEKIAPLGHAEDDSTARKQARTILTALGEGTWLQPIAVPDLRACGLLREILAAESPLADAVFALQALGTMPIQLAGSEELKQAFVEPALRGEAMAAFAMTEAEAGSDVAHLATRAMRDGSHYVLDGGKAFISNAGIADFYTVFAVTDPEAGKRGISCFVVPAETAGLSLARAQVMSAPHPLGELRFEGCRVPVSHRLGSEGEGLKIGLASLDRLRATVGAAACGMAQRALAEALAYSKQRHLGGQALAEYQLTQDKLARGATELTASRLLVYRALWERDDGTERTTVEAAMAKSYATEAAQHIIDDAIQILGGRGCLAEHPVDHLYRSIRSLRIYEGTTEIQRLIIARALLAGDS